MSSSEGNTSDSSLPSGENPDLILFGTSQHDEVPQTPEAKAVAISEALGNIGLHRAEKITVSRIKALGRETFESLDPLTAESVYFNLVRRTRKWLGNDPIQPKQFLQQAKFITRLHGNLEVFQLRQRLGDLGYLYELGFNPEQLRELLKGSDEEQQNINRLGFLLKSDPPHWIRLKPAEMRTWVEPKLRGYVEGLKVNADLEGPWSIESAVIEAQELLQKELDLIVSKSTDEDKQKWDSVAKDLYERVSHRLGSSIAIGHVILHSLRNSGTYPPQFSE